MRVPRLLAVLGCLVIAGCAAGPAGSSTAGTPLPTSTASGTGSPTADPSVVSSPATPTPPSATAPPTVRPTCTGTGGSAPNGARLKSPGTVTGAWICRGTTPSVATPAQADALAAALAQPTPPRRKVLCADNIRFDAPTWYLTTATGQVIRPTAPKDSCGQPIQAVQLAVAAISAS